MGKKRFQISGATARDFTHTPVAYASRSDVQIFYEDMLNVYDARMCCAEEDATTRRRNALSYTFNRAIILGAYTRNN